MPAGGAASSPGLLERWHRSGRLSLHSPKLEALGIAHGFTTRLGGLNVACAADLDASLREAGFGDTRVRIGRQTHGTHINARPDDPNQADGQFSAHGPDASAVAVRTADCLAVLMAGDAGVIAVHAGWRGLVGGIIPNAVRALGGSQGVAAVALGPCIGPKAFEIGPEVASRFSDAGLSACLRPGTGDRSFGDLSSAARLQLEECGVGTDRIDACSLCTHTRADLFFSFRRDGPGVGHQAGWIRPDHRKQP